MSNKKNMDTDTAVQQQENASTQAATDQESGMLADADLARFFGLYPEAKEYAQALSNQLIGMPQLDFEALLLSYINVLKEQVANRAELMNDDKFLQDVVYPSEKVRSHFKPSLMGAGGAMAVIPPKKPRSIADASEMARTMFQK